MKKVVIRIRHLGDITKINGADIEPVDVITAGSPCQDLSVAGKRAGLGGERSGLFMEQMRIIKEMRQHDRELGRADEYVRPRYMVWENVFGSLSSGKDENGKTLKGEDFRCVLEEIAKVIQEDIRIPRLEGGWPHSGSIILDNGSIAWRLHDAQFWGVPQRRKRICVLADFNGFTAARILLDPKLERATENGEPYSLVGNFGDRGESEVQPFRKGLQRDSDESGKKGQGTPEDFEGST